MRVHIRQKLIFKYIFSGKHLNLLWKVRSSKLQKGEPCFKISNWYIGSAVSVFSKWVVDQVGNDYPNLHQTEEHSPTSKSFLTITTIGIVRDDAHAGFLGVRNSSWVMISVAWPGAHSWSFRFNVPVSIWAVKTPCPGKMSTDNLIKCPCCPKGRGQNPGCAAWWYHLPGCSQCGEVYLLLYNGGIIISCRWYSRWLIKK